MKKSKLGVVLKVISSLLATIVIFQFIVWKFISTDTFGAHLSKFLNGYLSKYTQISIRYDRIEAKLFPPGIALVNLEVKSLAPFDVLESFDLKVGRIDVDAKLFTVKWNKFQVSNVELTDVLLQAKVSDKIFTHKKEENDWWKKINFKTLERILSLSWLDVQRLGVNKVDIQTNYASAKIDQISWELLENKIELKTGIKEVKVDDTIWQKIAPEKKSLLSRLSALEFVQAEFLLSQKEMEIKNFQLEVLGQSATAQGVVAHLFDSEKMKFILEVQAKIIHDARSTNESFPWHTDFTRWGINAFSSRSKMVIAGGLDSFSVNSYTDVEGLKSKFVDLDFASIAWEANKQRVKIKSILAKDFQGGEIKSKQSDIDFSFESGSLSSGSATFAASGIDLSNALGVVPAVSKALHGKLDGEVGFEIANDTKSFSINIADKSKVTNLQVQTSKGHELFALPQLQLHSTDFLIKSSQGVEFTGGANLSNEALTFNGNISSHNISVKTSEFNLSFDELRAISGVKVEGKGRVKIDVEGETAHPKLNFNLQNIEHTSILGFYVGLLSGKVIVDLEKDEILINGFQSKLSAGKMNAEGRISLKDFATDIDIHTADLSSLDLMMIHKTLIPWDMSFFEKTISNSNIHYQIGGKINSLQELTVKADIKTQRITWKSEEIYDISATLMFKDKILTVPNLEFKKGRGSVAMGLSYDLNTQLFKSAFKSKNLETTDLFLYKQVSPSFSSEVQLEGAFKSHKGSSEGVLNIVAENSRLNGEYIDDSYLALQWKDGVVKAQGKYANNWIKLNSVIDFNQSQYDASNKSFLTVTVNVPDWGKLFNIFSNFDNDDPVLKGRLHVEFDSLFNVHQPKLADLDLTIKELSLTHPSLQVKKTTSDRITITRGEIKKWDVVIKGIGHDQLISRAYGNIGKSAEIENVFDFSLGKLNYFLGSYLDLNGFVQSQLKVRINNGEFKYLGKVKSEDMILNSKDLVSSLDQSRLQLEYDNKEIRLIQLQSQMGSGTFNMTGNINWTSLYPAVTFRYAFNNAKIQLASRSMGILGGQGLIVGTQPPYVVGGDLKIVQAEILNEFTDFEFAKNRKQKQVKYLPSENNINRTDYLVFNGTVATDTPIVIRNSVAEMSLLANLGVTGRLSDPRLFGRVQIKNDKRNIFILKNNNFKINRLNLMFDNHLPVTNPSLDIDAESAISTYLVRAKVYGTMKDYQLDLTSDPALPRQSILSLIAFGYAENLSESMTNEDREALSSAGLGAFIFDQLKLNERLHSTLGLTLNVGTEYLNNSTSFLQGRSQQTGSNNVGQIRTATKLELRKKIDDRVGVSVSSTVGGNSGQKQAMNLNYLINKNVSLDAVYELNTDVAEGQERAGSAAGGDVKFRWTFK